MLELLLAALLGQTPAAPPATAALDYDFYKARVQPLFLEKREGHARCVTCHGGSTTLRLQRLPEGATNWSEEQSRQNFEAAMAMVVPGSPGASKLLRHPLAAHRTVSFAQNIARLFLGRFNDPDLAAH